VCGTTRGGRGSLAVRAVSVDRQVWHPDRRSDGPINHPFRVKLCPAPLRESGRNIKDGGVVQLMSTYQIRLTGGIPRDLLEKLPPDTEVVPAGLILRISHLDDAGLQGLVDAFRIANIDLLEVRQENCTTDP
jgi:hypothetical protein